MNTGSPPAASQAKTLRRLYLTLFLRGRTSRGLDPKRMPKSVAQRLAMILAFYTLAGCLCLLADDGPLFSLSIYLHGATLLFIGMFVATSAGEVLFNKDEAEILMHRPLDPRAMLWAKISVLLQIALLMGLAFNAVGMLKGSISQAGSPLYAPAHAVSITVEAFFCTGAVVVIYQLCLNWFGREKLDGLMTTAQVLMTLLLVAGSQMAPHLTRYLPGEVSISAETWWIFLLPPAWFSGLDEVLVGRATTGSWALAVCGLVVTGAVMALAFGRLARSYEAGLRTLNERKATKPRPAGKARFLEHLLTLPPLRWLVRHPLERAGFLLTGAYMMRDRDVKLRLYPGLAPMLMMPAIFLFNGARGHSSGDFMLIMAASYIPLLPVMAMNLLRYSQDWQAADVFHATPTSGPGRLIIGARKAVICLLVIPAFILVGTAVCWVGGGIRSLEALLPAFLALPFYSRIMACKAEHLPLSTPGEKANSAGRGLFVFGAMMSAFALGGAAATARYFGYLYPFLIVELVIASALALAMDRKVLGAQWERI